jgi:molybdopterin converting factor small subunit
MAREIAGSDAVDLALPAGATVGELRRTLVARWPEFERLLPHLMFAINSDYASDHTEIPAGASLACIPPVSGG